jgi:hypothetical protein
MSSCLLRRSCISKSLNGLDALSAAGMRDSSRTRVSFRQTIPLLAGAIFAFWLLRRALMAGNVAANIKTATAPSGMLIRKIQCHER